MDDMEKLRNDFTNWCLKQKWNNNILISMKTENNAVIYKIKILKFASLYFF